MDLNQLLEQWLKDNNAELIAVALAPKGGYVNVENFLPDLWKSGFVVKKKDEPSGQVQVSK